jgi:uncharacterized membrane protein
MPEDFFMARLFLIGGGLLAVIGLILWFVLPIASMFPPYAVTALLALGYGGACWWRGSSRSAGKP